MNIRGQSRSAGVATTKLGDLKKTKQTKKKKLGDLRNRYFLLTVLVLADSVLW